MMRLATFTGAALGGWAGWDLGQPVGIGTAFLISAIGSIAGVVGGWWLVRRYFE
ncbi:hypothetical protein [Acidihalobacter ferrooxydans]|uniref:hypothetical protein n=1 Tax=Acidihalobacter ferrooxydans TaxID=1765967 RepID=UPI0012EB5E58|nr:hypothetical protein [Acidihalobacter ferrooxydans]